MRNYIIPSIIAKNQQELDNLIGQVKGFSEIAQLDIMDGKFVENESINFEFTLPKSSLKYEVHLMINDPMGWIEKNHAKVDTILVHIETINDPDKIIDYVKSVNKKVGFALNPQTSIEIIKPYLDKIDEVLIMTVVPGRYGAPFLSDMLDKVRKIRELNQDIDIEVDGGISDKTIKDAHDAGANLFISGSYIIKSDDPRKAMNALYDLIGGKR